MNLAKFLLLLLIAGKVGCPTGTLDEMVHCLKNEKSAQDIVIYIIIRDPFNFFVFYILNIWTRKNIVKFKSTN